MEDMNSTYEEKCRELAGFVLSRERGLNTPKRRRELADNLKELIDNYVDFEKSRWRFRE